MYLIKEHSITRMHKSFHAIMLKDVRENAFFVLMDNWLRRAVCPASVTLSCCPLPQSFTMFGALQGLEGEKWGFGALAEALPGAGALCSPVYSKPRT